MIVDDEVPIRQWFRFCIEKYPSDFEVVCEAGDGQEALELLEHHSVDVIITDIRMPKMDGIELMKKVKQKYSSIEIILLTCYEEFEYAKAAISEGAYEYMLKTAVRDKEIIEVLNKVKKVIIEQPSQKSVIGLHNRVTEEALNQYPLEDRIDYENQPMIAIALSCVKMASITSIGNILGELRLSNVHIQWWIEVSDQMLVLLFKLGRHNIQSEQEKEVNMITEQINSITFKLGVSLIHYNFGGILEAVLEAKIALNQRFYHQKYSMIIYNTKMKRAVDREWIKGELNEFLNCELKHDFSGAIEIAEGIMTLFNKLNYWDINYIYEIAYIMLNMVKNSGHVDYGQNWKGDLKSCVYEHKTFEDLNAFIILNIRVQKTNNPLEHDAVGKGVMYINENFMKQMTLVEVAKYVHLNPEYFSRLFHECMGMRFSHYLSNKRLETAFRLYNSSNLKLYEIGEAVGYLNHSYFSRKFRDYIRQQKKEVK